MVVLKNRAVVVEDGLEESVCEKMRRRGKEERKREREREIKESCAYKTKNNIAKRSQSFMFQTSKVHTS